MSVVVYMQYPIELVVVSDHKTLDDLTDLLLAAPQDSVLSNARVCPEHTDKYPRFRLRRVKDYGTAVQFVVPERYGDPGRMYCELANVFQKSGWKIAYWQFVPENLRR